MRKRKKGTIGIILLLILLLSACTAQGVEEPSSDIQNQEEKKVEETDTNPESSKAIESYETEPQPSEAEEEEERILILYFTMPEPTGTDAVSGASRVVIDGELMGNTEYVADLIHTAVGGELFIFETQQEYPAEHDALVDQAADEQDRGARPELKTEIGNVAEYDVIFLGYPNWWGDLPMPLYTLLENNDFSGKTIIPFCTHGGSGLSNTIATIQTLQPDAEVVNNGLSISRDSVADSETKIAEWLKEIGMTDE